MLKLLRLLMIALLALAIPVQGVAAATMLYCGPDHGPGGDAVHAHQAAGASQAHEGHGQDMHEHAQPNTPESPQSPEQSAQAKCSVCAACCNAVAISSSAMRLSPAGAEPEPALKPSSQFYSFITDGPRRPPRSFLI